MYSLNKFLERIKNSLDISTVNKNAIQSEIERVTRVIIDTKDIDIKGDVLWLKTTPTRMTEIKMNESLLLDSLGRILNQRVSRISYK